ncbi:MAG: YegS/Rv2252/BmrU family lipid kinase [Ardenticatenaceae bacterium]|nr:YegS/Rv2252/BmrU family lipid kinase [Ardenticatenaceae bacterium]
MSFLPIIINPAAGNNEPILNTLNDVFSDDVKWEVKITHASGDARRFAEEAVARQAAAVGVYGGDGTITEVAQVLANRDIPMLLLPGGTGNGVARMLEIPVDLRQAAALWSGNSVVRKVDLGCINNHPFLLRADIGFLAKVDVETPRLMKDRFGKWAYAFSTFQHLSDLKPVAYQLKLDDEELEMEAVLVTVVNMAALVWGHRPIAAGVSPDDGLLDVFLLTRDDIVAITEVVSTPVLGTPAPMYHWQVKSAEIHTTPLQPLAIDGEGIETASAAISVMSQSVNIIVPAFTVGEAE